MIRRLINNILWYSTGWVFFGLIVLSGIAGGLAASVLHFTTTDAFWLHFAFFCCCHCPFASGCTGYLAYTGVSNVHAHKVSPCERVVFPVRSMRSRVTGAYPATPSGVNAIRHSALAGLTAPAKWSFRLLEVKIRSPSGLMAGVSGQCTPSFDAIRVIEPLFGSYLTIPLCVTSVI